MANDRIKIPRFLEGEELPAGYFDPVDPYSDPPKSQYDLKALIQYAREHGKNVVDLSKEEVKPFRIAVSVEEGIIDEEQKTVHGQYK